LNEKYKIEIEKMKEMTIEYTNHVNLLNIENISKLDELKKEHELKVNRLKDELKEEYENQIKEIKENYEKELKYLERSNIQSPNDSISKELCQKLQDQVEKTKELDKHLMNNINENVAKTNEQYIPEKIKVLDLINL
jgi:hypothetical protein